MLIVKEGEQVGFLRFFRRKSKVGLVFVQDHQEALARLLADESIPEECYYYWNDVVNAVGYTPKILLMCAALECLTRTGHGEKDFEKLERILGKELKEELNWFRSWPMDAVKAPRLITRATCRRASEVASS